MLDHLDDRSEYSVMNLKFSTLLIGLTALLLTQTKSLVAQQIFATMSILCPVGTLVAFMTADYLPHVTGDEFHHLTHADV